jgi:diaminohydroxyphosphoribosylaminopyrimidine deaminase/5-amino-6-(5-phosphoribosylamino)uracil reductase
MNDEHYMRLALELAARGRGRTSPNPMVGAVVVKDGRVVGEGWHQRAGGPHAEVHAIEAAGEAAREATLYVTLEPCNHTGRTPPCAPRILQAGIRRVVVAMRDPNPEVAGGGAEWLGLRGVAVAVGVCEAEAQELNEAFVTYVRTRRPFVIAKCAATLDGRIATSRMDSKWVTGAAARAYVHEIRHAVDAVLVGVGTVAADNPALTTRLTEGEGQDPTRIILDTHLRVSPAARVLGLSSSAETLIVCGRHVPPAAKARLERKGVRVLEADAGEGGIDLAALMPRLGAMGITSLLIEGGGRVLGAAFRAGIVNKACFFFAPLVTAGDDGVPICRGSGPERMRDCVRLERIGVRRFGDDVLIEGYVKRVAGG